MLKNLSIPLAFVISVILFLPAVSHAKTFKSNMMVMGTDLEVTVSAGDEAESMRAFKAVKDEMLRIEYEMSEWIEGTYVSRINKNSGIAPVEVPEELFKVIAASQEVSRLSGGAFDISWASMRGIWDFSKGKERVASPEEIKKRLPLVNYKNIVLDGRKKTVFLKEKGMAIGLGAIAKGYAVDKAMEKLSGMGIKDAIVRAGGDMRVQGLDEGRPWEIGIKHPRQKGALIAKLKLSNTSISTSGDYERYFIKDGILYHHIMDPKTGYPAGKCQSVTILATDTMTSDALSTAVFVMGPEEGMKLVEGLKGVQAIIVDVQGHISASRGMEVNNPAQ